MKYCTLLRETSFNRSRIGVLNWTGFLTIEKCMPLCIIQIILFSLSIISYYFPQDSEMSRREELERRLSEQHKKDEAKKKRKKIKF